MSQIQNILDYVCIVYMVCFVMNKLNEKQYQSLLSMMFLVGVTIILIAVLLVVFEESYLVHAELSTRDQINELKGERTKEQQRLGEIPLLIDENESRQSSLSELRDRYQLDLEELKELKDDSFTSQENIELKEKQIRDVKNDIEELKEEKILLLNEISQVKMRINELDAEIRNKSPRVSNTQAIGIVLSKSCLTEIYNLIPNPNYSFCPSYDRILSLDNSNYLVSGSFGFEDGEFKRLDDAKYVNSWRWYDLNDYLIFVDPPASYYKSLKMIYVEQQLDNFTNITQLEKENHVRSLSHDRYTTLDCKEATITTDNWEYVLPDTILYLRQNCNEDFTNLDTITFIEDTHVEHDITTSQKWILEQYQRKILSDCTKSYGDCNHIENPWSN